MSYTYTPNIAFEEVPEAKESVMLIDGLNLFFRSFAAIDTLNPNGAHIGGLAGFIQSLSSLINLASPKFVYIFFDGLNSTETKKMLVRGYKKGRGNGIRRRNQIFESEYLQELSKKQQLKSLFEYLKNIPVKTIVLNGAEADDAISYVARNIKDNTVIVSTDKDFLQTCSHNNFVYSPSSKKVFTKQSVLDQYGVLSENFILLKTLMGDKSDNIKGIDGVGAKKAVKLFPELSKRVISLSELFELAKERKEGNQIYSKIIYQKHDISNQHKIMNLSEPMIHESHKENLYKIIVEEKKQVFNENNLRELIKVDYLYPVLSNVDKTLSRFNQL